MLKHMQIAFDEYGISETKGSVHNKKILEYFAVSGHSWVKNDETAWCAAFANYVCRKAGVESTGKLNARSFLDIGKKVSTPKFGDLVIFWRGKKSGWQGHVGFFVTARGNYIYTLGGNQSDKVTISAYDKSRLLGYRRLTADTSSSPFNIKKVDTPTLVKELLRRFN
jgi:uncharacterized protein (TIGR02594 family)